MRSLKLLLTAVLACSNLAACSTKGVINRAEDPTPEKSGTVIVYRTKPSFQAGNPAPNFVYMNDEQIGRMRNGAKFTLTLNPGVYTFSVKQSMMFVPAFTVARLEVTVAPGTTQYLRYDYGFAGVVILPGYGGAQGVHSLNLVSQRQAEAFE
jgi:uncharacterized protein DUF2846